MSHTTAADYPALGFDPTPGDIEKVRLAVGSLRSAAAALREISTVLAGTGAEGEWRGKAAIAFRELVSDDLRPRIETASQSFDDSVRALDGWVEFMTTAQARTRTYEADAAAALKDANRRQSLDAASPLVDLPPVPSAASDQLDALRAQARHHGSEYQRHGDEVAAALTKSLDAAPNEPGFWSRLGDTMGGALDSLGTLAGDLGTVIGDIAEAIAPAVFLIANIAGFLGASLGLLALIPGLQVLALPAVIFGLVALGGHYYAGVVATGNPLKALLTKDVILDAVGVVGGIAALKAGGKALAAAKAAGSQTKSVPQLIGPAREMPLGYFDLARTSYPMSSPELSHRLVQYHGTAAGNVSNLVSSPDTVGDVDDWTHRRYWDPSMGGLR